MTASAVSAIPAPSAAAAGDHAGRHAAARRALAHAEGRRLLLHPLFIGGMGFSILFISVGSAGGGTLYSLVGGCFTFLGAALWIFVVTCLAAGRARRDGVEDMYRCAPLTPQVRTQAALLSVGYAGLAAAVLIVLAAAVTAGADAAIVVEGERYGLRPLELLQGPLSLVFFGMLGVLVGTWTRRAYPAVIGALLLFMPPLAWMPWHVYGPDVPAGISDDWLAGASVAWHLAGYAGLIALAAAGALARHDRRPRIAALAVAGVGLAVAGIVLGWPPNM